MAAEPARQLDPRDEEDTRPNLRGIEGGGESTPRSDGRHLSAVPSPQNDEPQSSEQDTQPQGRHLSAVPDLPKDEQEAPSQEQEPEQPQPQLRAVPDPQEEEPDLYQREKDATGKDAKDKDEAGDKESAALGAAADKADRGQSSGDEKGGDSEKQKPKGLRGRFRERRARLILGTLGTGTITGAAMFALLSLAPAFGLPDLTKGLSDFEFGPTENIRARRQARLAYDFIKNGRDGVLEGRRIGNYNTRLENRWRDFNMRRFAGKAEALNYKFDWDPDLRDKNGQRINTRTGDAPEFDDAGRCTNCVFRMPSAIEADDGTRIVLARDGALLDAPPQAETRAFFNKMFGDVYPSTIIDAAQRMHYRGFYNTAFGFRWGKFFTETSTSSLARAYNAIFNPDSRADPSVTEIDTDAEPDPDGEPSGEVETADAENLNETKRTLLERVRAGFSPRTVMQNLSTKLFGSVRASIGTGSVVLGLASLACVAQDLYQGDVDSQWNRYQSLMAYGSFMLSVSGEIQNGGFVSLEEVGELYHEFISRETVVVDDAGNSLEIVESIGNSATVQRANGKAVIDGDELAPENKLKVDRNGAYQVFASLGSKINAIPASDGFCGFLNSAWGQFLGFLGGLAECFFSAGSLCAAGEVVSEIALAVWGDDLFRAVFGLSLGNDVGLVGMAFPPQSAEIAAQALSAMDSENSRGGVPIDNDTYNGIVAQYMDDRQERINDLPFTERYFAVSTPGSIGQELAFWRMDAQHKSVLENAASLFKLPFQSMGSLFSSPAHAQPNRKCLSENDYRVAPGTCVEHDNFEMQKFSYDVVIQCGGKNINLLEGVNVDDPSDNEYGMNWAEEQVLLIMQGGSADGLSVECPQFAGKAELAQDMAEICHGLIFADGQTPRFDLRAKRTLYSDPKVHGTDGADTRNKEVRQYCHNDPDDGVDSLLENVDDRQLYGMIGRYVDDLIQTDGMVAASGGDVSASISGTTEAPSRQDIAIIGDTLTAGMQDTYSGLLSEGGWQQVTVDGEDGRTLREGAIEIERLVESGRSPQQWIIDLGIADILDGVSGADARNLIEDALDAIPDGAQVSWINTYLPEDFGDASFNSALSSIARRTTNLQIIDWNSYARQNRDVVLADDSRTLTEDGYRLRAEFLANQPASQVDGVVDNPEEVSRLLPAFDRAEASEPEPYRVSRSGLASMISGYLGQAVAKTPLNEAQSW